MAKSARSPKTTKKQSTVRNSRITVSGPAEPDASGSGDPAAEKVAATQDVASAFAFNTNKAAEYDPKAAIALPEGVSVKPNDPIAGASTVSELNGSDKVGSGGPNIGRNPTVGSLDRVSVDSSDCVLTTNQGVPIADNQNSLKAGLRGPTLLEDFLLREKINAPIAQVHDNQRGGMHRQAIHRGRVSYEPNSPGRWLSVPGRRGGDPSKASDAFIKAIAKHRHFMRDTDPPRV
jgi:hypothetical protein